MIYYIPTVLAWTAIALYDSSTLLAGLTSSLPWILLSIPLLLACKNQSTLTLSKCSRQVFSSILLLMGAQLGHHALYFFMSFHFNAETIPLSISIPWPMYFAVFIAFKTIKNRPFRLYDMMPKTLRHPQTNLIVLQLAKTPIGLLIPFLCLPLLLGFFHSLSYGEAYQNHPSLIFSLPILWFAHKRLIKLTPLRKILHEGCPIFLVIIVYCIAFVMCISLTSIVITQLVPHKLVSLITWHHPWPFAVTQHSAWMISWTWWLLLATPICVTLAQQQKGLSLPLSIGLFMLSIVLCMLVPSVESLEQGICYAMLSFLLLAGKLLSGPSFSAMHLGHIAATEQTKQRNHARQIQQSLLISSLFSTTILAIGGDFLFWSLGIGLCTLLIFIWLCCFHIAFNREPHEPYQ